LVNTTVGYGPQGQKCEKLGERGFLPTEHWVWIAFHAEDMLFYMTAVSQFLSHIEKGESNTTTYPRSRICVFCLLARWPKLRVSFFEQQTDCGRLLGRGSARSSQKWETIEREMAFCWRRIGENAALFIRRES
jgi:hypothetical protein